MDLANNAVGRKIAVNNPGASNEQLSDLCMKALREVNSDNTRENTLGNQRLHKLTEHAPIVVEI